MRLPSRNGSRRVVSRRSGGLGEQETYPSEGARRSLRSGGARGFAQPLTDGSEHDTRLGGLGDVAVASGFDRLLLVTRERVRRQRDDRDVFRRRIGLEAAGGFP